MNIAEVLKSLVTQHPQKNAIVFKDRVISFATLEARALSLAASLVRLGVKKNDKVAIYLPSCPEYVYSYLAIWCCGAVAVPLDFMLTEEEVVLCSQHAEAKVFIGRGKPAVALERIKANVPTIKEIIACQEDSGAFHPFEAALAKGSADFSPVTVSEKDYAIIFYTSGTTGKPKGVLINYKQLEAPAKAVEYFVKDMEPDDTTLCALPLSHLGGLIYLQVNLFFGNTVVLVERFAPLDFLKHVQQHKINWFWLVPSMYYAFLQLKEFEQFDLSSLRWIVIFGAPSSSDAIRRFMAHCPKVNLFHGWGMTETNAPTTVIPPGSKKIESVGKPVPWVEIKIVDNDDKEMPQGQIGEIVLRGWVVTDGYYKDPVLTQETNRNGWFHTGDLGRFDAEGYLSICGRKKEMIKVAGEIVFEPEVEAAIHKHEHVAEVAVIGVPDKMRGELPKAFVVLKTGAQLSADELRAFCRQHLAHFKIPHSFEFVSSLPKNRTGKIDKQVLRLQHA